MNILLATKPVPYCAQNTMETLESIYSNATFLLKLQNRLFFPVKYYKKNISDTDFFFKRIPNIILILLLFILPLILELITVLRYYPPEWVLKQYYCLNFICKIWNELELQHWTLSNLPESCSAFNLSSVPMRSLHSYHILK